MEYTLHELITLCILSEVEIKHPLFNYSHLEQKKIMEIAKKGIDGLKEKKAYENRTYADETMLTAKFLKDYSKYEYQFIYSGIFYSYDLESKKGVMIGITQSKNFIVIPITSEYVFYQFMNEGYLTDSSKSYVENEVKDSTKQRLLEIENTTPAMKLEYWEKGVLKRNTLITEIEEKLFEYDIENIKEKQINSYYLKTLFLRLLGGPAYG